MVELLDLRQGGLAQTLDGNFPDLRTSVWQSDSTVQAAVQVSDAGASALSHHTRSHLIAELSLMITDPPCQPLDITCFHTVCHQGVPKGVLW